MVRSTPPSEISPGPRCQRTSRHHVQRTSSHRNRAMNSATCRDRSQRLTRSPSEWPDPGSPPPTTCRPKAVSHGLPTPVPKAPAANDSAPKTPSMRLPPHRRVQPVQELLRSTSPTTLATPSRRWRQAIDGRASKARRAEAPGQRRGTQQTPLRRVRARDHRRPDPHLEPLPFKLALAPAAAPAASVFRKAATPPSRRARPSSGQPPRPRRGQARPPEAP